MGGPLCTRVFLLALSCYGAAPLAMGASSPWWNQLISYDTFDITEYAILQSTRLLPRRYGFDRAGSEHSDPRAAKRLAKCACQGGFSALAACPHPATGAGPGSG
jgi:hypothetical protein